MEPPPDGQAKRGFLQRIRVRLRQVKDTLKHALRFRPQVQHPETSPKTSLISRILCRSHPDTPLASLWFPNSKGAIWNRLTDSLRSLESLPGLFPPLKSAVGAFIGCLEVVKAATLHHEDYQQIAEELRSTVDVVIQHAGELEFESSCGSVANISQCIEDQVAYIKRQDNRGTCDLSMRTKTEIEKQLETTLLQNMSPVDDARYDSGCSITVGRRGCTAKTREAVHQTLQDWTTHPGSARIYWMNGMAGTGKTTVAYSYCEWLESTNQLGASFFCSHVSSTCRSLNRIIPTIAYQLAHFSPAFRPALCAALKDGSDTGMLNVMQQFEGLINLPMLDAKSAMPDNVVVVIDALDECGDKFSVRLVLDVLFKFADQLPLKFFVASRPEHVIREQMMSQVGESRALLYLHDIEQSLVEEDIKKYLTEALSSMTPPPSFEQIELLTKRSRNLFIYAATIVRYIYPEDIHVDSRTRFESLLATLCDSKVISESEYGDLDLLYTTVLSAALNARLNRAEEDCMRRVLWTIVRAKEPMTAATIAFFASIEERRVWAVLQPLRSVVHVPEDNTPISTYHASFPDYMLDELRSGNFYCNESQSNERLFHRCFEVMKRELRFNICNLDSSYLTDDLVLDLETRVPQCISHTLSYACRYWSSHLLLAPPSENTRDMIVDFLSNRLLFWLEVLSLSRCIGTGAPMMRQVQVWLRVRHFIFSTGALMLSSIISQKFVDAPDEIQKRVSDAPLPSCARSNWVSQHYSRRKQGLAQVSSGQRDESLLAVWLTEAPVFSLTISPDGEYIASSQENGTIQIHDSQTGSITIGPLTGHRNKVCSVAFSPDGKMIASGSSDATILTWDASNGRIISGPLLGHKDAVWSVSFSPDGSLIVSGSHDRTVIVWNALSGDIVLGPLQGHSEVVWSVVFSPDGRLIASGSGDHTIMLWDASTGSRIAQPLEGHEGGVRSIAFSPDGVLIASGSEDGKVRMWDVQTSTSTPLFPHFEGHAGMVMSVAFSPDGTQIVSGGGNQDRKVIVWDVRTCSVLAGPFSGHTWWLSSVIFSPAGDYVFSGSCDRTIRMWDICPKNTAIPLDTHEASFGPIVFPADHTQFFSRSLDGAPQVWDVHTGLVKLFKFNEQTKFNSAAFSSEGSHIAAGTDSFTIWIWDVNTGATISAPLEGHNGEIRCIVFSPDSALICSGSDDTTIIVWDIRASATVGRTFNGHSGSVRSLAFSHDGTLIASGATDTTVRIWDAVTGALIHTLDGHTSPIDSVAFSPDANSLVSSATDGSVHKWDLQATHSAGNPYVVLLSDSTSGYEDTSALHRVGFSPDGAYIIAGSGSDCHIFDTQSGEAISVLSSPSGESIRWVGYSSDGSHIISAATISDTGDPRRTGQSSRDPSPGSNIIRVWHTGTHIRHSSTTAGAWTYTRDGQILSDDGLVMWVPPDLLPSIRSMPRDNVLVHSSRGIIDIGYKELFIGERWAECYIHQDGL